MGISKYKSLIEESLAFIGTADDKGLPNVTVVDRPILLDNGKVIIADVMMTSCSKNLSSNPECAVLFFDFKENVGLKVFGKTKYILEGPIFLMIEEKLKGSGYKAKGAIEITPQKLIEVS